jgi:hypothetical protein
MESRVLELRPNIETGGLIALGPYGTRIEFDSFELIRLKSEKELERFLTCRMLLIERLLNIPTGKRK